MSDVLPVSVVNAVLLRYGWVQEEAGERASLWKHLEAAGRPQIYVPSRMALGGLESGDLARRIADIANVPRRSVEGELALGQFDVVRVRIAEARNDTVALSAGSTVVESARGMLRAVATTARRPQRRIRNYSERGDEIVRDARLGHTEKGSMVFPVLFRLDEPAAPVYDTVAGMDVESVTPESEQRRVTRTLAESLAMFTKTVLERAVEPSQSSLLPFVAAGGSRELMRNVENVLKAPGIGALDVSFQWAPVELATAPPVPSVDIPHDTLDLIQSSVRVLSVPDTENRSTITGRIITISHDTDGPVFITIQTAGTAVRLQKVELLLPATLRSTLHEWMDAGTTVTATGRIERRPGVTSRLVDLEGPFALEDLIALGDG